MSRTAQNGKGSRRRVGNITDEDWDLAFKRDGKNTEKNRYKRGDKRGDKHKDGD